MPLGPIAGVTDFSHQSFDDIIGDLENYSRFLSEIVETNKERIASLEEKGKYWSENIDFDFKNSVAYNLKFFETAKDELSEIRVEMLDEVEENHIKRLRSIYETASESYVRVRKTWKTDDYGWKDYGNDNFRIAEMVYFDMSDVTATMFDISNMCSRLEDFKGKRSKSKRKKRSTKTDFDLSNRWWRVALIVGVVGTIISYLLINNFTYSIILGLIAGMITFFRNPKTRYMRAFWSVFSLLITVNFFSLNLILNYLMKTENSDLDIHLSIKEPSIILSILLGILMIILAILDYFERKK